MASTEAAYEYHTKLLCEGIVHRVSGVTGNGLDNCQLAIERVTFRPSFRVPCKKET